MLTPKFDIGTIVQEPILIKWNALGLIILLIPNQSGMCSLALENTVKTAWNAT